MSTIQKTIELNLDGLGGPTHTYAGLSEGNSASARNRARMSHPKAAALQGLDKMKLLADLGVQQAVLPPQERPALGTLRQLGFTGTAETILRRASQEAPELLRACASASSMWAANVATTTPSIDAADRRVHLTPANLVNALHRSLETHATGRVLRTLFPQETGFAHHKPLPCTDTLSDEGAANHIRLCEMHGTKGLHLFVFGRQALSSPTRCPRPREYPARQTYEASQAICRLHRIPLAQVLFAQQHPAAIDQGVFHNDVIATGNQNMLLYHELAFVNTEAIIAELRARYRQLTQQELYLYQVASRQLSVRDAVQTYLFNCQIVTLPGGAMVVLAPLECQDSPTARAILHELQSDPACPIEAIEYVDLTQSMLNGGGPACLRLRVILTADEVGQMRQTVLLTPVLYTTLRAWVEKHYRDRLFLDELADPLLLQESHTALDELTQLLQLGSIYPFQQ